jgi:membrane-bound lytic murein transglycosylase D
MSQYGFLLQPLMIITVILLLIGCFPQNSPRAATVNEEVAVPALIKVPHADALQSATSSEAEKGSDESIADQIDSDNADRDGELSEDNGKESGPESSLDTAMALTESAHEYWVEGDVERSLEALDQAYGLIAGVDAGGDPGLLRQKEDLRYTISKRIVQIYASRYTSAKGSHNPIPFTMNKYVEREIESFKNEERRFFVDAYKRSGRFRGDIVKALKEAGLPEELSWLPLIESGFNVKALSRARALGLWQFIPSTGYKFGLRRTNWIDERMDPAKSTAAAIAYLRELHSIFGDWATVLAAYNCGEGTVLRAIRRQKINYLDNFWDLYERLPVETARYYPRFLAVLAILKDPARYNMELDKTESSSEFEVVTVQKQLHLKTIAERLSLPFEELSALNPELRRHITPASYSLKVPAGKGQIALAMLDRMQQWSVPKSGYVVHRVRRGESLFLLALRYRTSIRAIENSNQLRRNKLLRVGQKLRIPLTGT